MKKLFPHLPKCHLTCDSVLPPMLGLLVWLLLMGTSFAACVGESKRSAAHLNREVSAAALDRWIQQAEQAVRIGFRKKARALLEAVVQKAREQNDVRREAIGLGALGNSYTASNLALKAKECLNESLSKADELENNALRSLVYLDLANYQATLGSDRQGADASFVDAIVNAELAGRPDIVVRARLNRSYLLAKKRPISERVIEAIGDDLELAERDIPKVKSGVEQARLWLALGRRWLTLSTSNTVEGDVSQAAYRAINTAKERAVELERSDIEASSLGALGLLYQHAGRSKDALQLYRQAEHLVRRSDAPNSAYIWSWRIGSLMTEINDRQGAIEAYQRAVNMTEAIRRSMADVRGHGDFTPTVLKDTQTLLSEYLELLFDENAFDREELNNIRGLVEQQREVEVQTFFQDDCLADLKSRVTTVEKDLGKDTALIYPVRLREKWVLLVEINGKLDWITLDVAPAVLASQVEAFRDALARDGSAIAKGQADRNRYLEPSQALHRMVMARFDSVRGERKINTIVFVPTGPFRSIPLAALHDGNQFLIHKYAFVTLPGLSLLDFEQQEASAMRALVGGLTDASLGFNPLPNVTNEVDNVRRSIPRGVDLLGSDFVPERLQRDLDAYPYTIVHIASHAEIGARAKDSYVVTHGDKKLDLDDLEALLKSSQYRDQPVELLTLSACQTADGKGQDQSALGLAGIAVKSGARSALGTLWPVFDQSSPVLMDAFYAAITSGRESTTKAIALQEAQLELLKSDKFNHPFFWAPYLLIGNWL